MGCGVSTTSGAERSDATVGTAGTAVAANTTTAVTPTAAVAVAPAVRPVRRGIGKGHRPVLTGRSSSTYEAVAAASVAANRTTSSGVPSSPVRSWLISANSGQCHRYTP